MAAVETGDLMTMLLRSDRELEERYMEGLQYGEGRPWKWNELAAPWCKILSLVGEVP